ncbi:MAG: MMPL family transporter, partial [Thermoleophilia bacterium]|nr:MMPL family transporter [Thermoleophilia bacterium]
MALHHCNFRGATILFALALLAVVTAVFFLRPARSKPVPSRVVPGDGVCTDEGTVGVVLRVEHGAALVQIDTVTAVWTDAALLMDAEGNVPAATRDAAALRIIAMRTPSDRDLASDGHDALPALDAFPTPRSIAAEGGWLQRVGAAMFDARGIIVCGWVIAVIVCLPLSGTAEKSFTAGGYTPDGETLHVINDMRDTFGLPIARVDVIVPGTPAGTQKRLDDNVRAVYRVPHMVGLSKPVASKDGKLSTFTVYFNTLDEDTVDSYDPLIATLTQAGFPPKQVQLAGTPSFYYDIGDQTKKDLAKAEQIGIPLALLVLLFVFGTAVSAVLPLIVGITSVIITLAMLHLLSIPMHLSVYVMNIASMLGLGLGIDYSLLGVSRFRSELAAGASTRDAVITTVTSAGRAAAISGGAVLVGMSALALIPLKVMVSMAIAGVVVVAVSVLATLTLLPALLALLGPRVEKLPVRRVK